MTARAVSIPGTSLTGTGSDQAAEFSPNPALTGSGLPATTFYGNASPTDAGAAVTGWPKDDFTILAVNMTVNTNDPNAQWYCSMLGAAGWTLTPVMTGQGTVRQEMPQGRAFAFATDYIRFHVNAASGDSILINGAIELI